MRLPTQTMKKLGFELVRQSKTSITLKYVKNGMTVVLMPDKLSTVVTSNIIYMVGSRHEGNGETGAAHLFEHLMFKETAKHNKKDGTGFDDLMKAVGAEWNATTYYDRTHYYEVGSPDLLELFMQIESDRMRGLILRKSDLDSEMPVVLQEFARGENNPRSALNKEVWSCAFKEHPYKMETIGSKSDVFGVPMERLQAFYDKFYWPNNAILVIFGKLEMSSTLKLIAKYFGHIPASPKPIPTVYTVEPKQEGQKRAILRRAGDNEIVQIAFHTPKALHPDTAALAVAANILGSDSSRNSRLYKRLLKEKQLANDFGTSNLALHDSGMFEVVADVMQDSNVQEVEGVLFEEIYKLKTELVSDEELNLNKQALCKGLTLKMVDNEEKLFYITESIASASLESLENRNAEIKAVTKEDILRVANVYFLEDNSTVGHFLPKKSNQQTNEDSEESQFAESDQESQVQKDNQAPQEVKDKIEQDNCAANQFDIVLPSYLAKKKKNPSPIAAGLKRIKMSNGATLLILERPKTGVVSLAGHFGNAGTFFATDNDMVPIITASMLTRGSRNLSADALDAAMDEMGTGLTFRTGGLSSSFAANVTKEDIGRFVRLLGTVLREPEFSMDELKQCQAEEAQGLLTLQSNTGAQARIKLSQTLYPEGHLFHMIDVEPSIAMLAKVTRDDLVAFHREAYGSTTATFTLVGDITAEEATKLFEETFANWSGNAARTISIGEVSAPAQAQRRNVNIPDKKSTDILIGHPVTIQATSPDLVAASLGNSALGGGSIDSRLGQVVREKNGLTYSIRSVFDDLSVPFQPWLIKLSVDPEKVEPALSLVQQVVADFVKNGIDQAELEIEKGRAKGMLAVRLANPVALAATLLSYEASGRGAEYVDTYLTRVKNTTKEEVDAAASKYFSLDRSITVVAGTLS